MQFFEKYQGANIIVICFQCFNSFGTNEKTLLNNLDNIINYAELAKDAGMIELSPPNLVSYEDYTKTLKRLSRYDGVYLYKIGKSSDGKNIFDRISTAPE